MLKAGRIAGALAVTAAVLALAGCGGGDGSGGGGGGSPATSSPSAEADPYRKAPWRMQVVNLLDALRTPQDGRYRSWLSDDPDYAARSFAYTPRSAGDPGWGDRDDDGVAVVYPSEFEPGERTAFFDALTRDSTVVAASLQVTKADKVPQGGNGDYRFDFKVRTSTGTWLTGQAVGNGLDAAKGRITRLTYGVGAS